MQKSCFHQICRTLFISNFLNFSSKSIFVTINFIELKNELQLILGSLSQVLLTNINFFELFVHKQHLFRFVNILVKEKNLLV